MLEEIVLCEQCRRDYEHTGYSLLFDPYSERAPCRLCRVRWGRSYWYQGKEPTRLKDVLRVKEKRQKKRRRTGKKVL